ncbi:unnamed protein product [Echinostoma caproni]|uniref:Uncharacterized protein n=1 Tax=Echinostoma caproni TaxID=27848 RepID=A0A183BC64_9TREM|nr:unnamed protein product [Echinostoma caproni]
MTKRSADDFASLPKSVSLTDQLRRLLSQLMTLSSYIITGGFVQAHSAPTISAPDKFCFGDDFSLWVADAKSMWIYARALVLQDDILDEEITDDTFSQLRFTLTTSKNPMLLQFQFQTRVQNPDVAFDVYVRTLRRLVNHAFFELPRETREEKVLHQLHVGVRNAGLIRKLHRYRPLTVHQVIDTAQEEEQLEDVIR